MSKHARLQIGDVYLTEQQRAIINLVAQGLDNREIAERLCLERVTVACHIHDIYQLLGINKRKGGDNNGVSRVRTVLWWQEHNQ